MSVNASGPIVLHDREPVPEGCVTFGQLVLESIGRTEAVREQTKDEKHHAGLYVRWLRIYAKTLVKLYPPSNPIFSDIRHWEWYVCRWLDWDENEKRWNDLKNDPRCCAWFFDALSDSERRGLCNDSRTIRRSTTGKMRRSHI